MADVQLSFTQKPGIAGPMLKALFTSRKGFNAEVGLPNITGTWKDVNVDKDALKQYLSTLSLPESQQLPVLYPHVLAGAMHMHMLTHKAFPIKLLGALHLKNAITQHKPIAIDDRFDITSQLGGFRLVEKGVEFDFDTQVIRAGETVWEETSTYFMAGRFGGKDNPSPERSFDLEAIETGASAGTWFIPANRGKVYAKITGDYNPIHTSKQLAKLFGFKRDIAHGFGVLAQGLNEFVGGKDSDADSVNVEVIFKGPVFLESDVQLESDTNGSGRFDIYCADNDRPSICAKVS